jgi:peptidoglycan/LPS O-acetylase OafA/YrhL
VSGLGLRQLGRGDDPTTVAVDAGTTIVSAAPAEPSGGLANGAAPAPRRDATVFPGFDGLRAIAALLVLVVHVSFMTTLTLRSRLGPYAARAEIGVAVFFLISGFLLYRPFVARHFALADRGGGRDRTDAGGFLIRRVLRIVPLYWLVFVISLIVITDRMIVDNVGGLLECLLFVQGYHASWVLQGLTQSWTLDVEFAFYLFVPLYAWLFGRRVRAPRVQLLWELTGVAGLYVAGTLVHWRMIGHTTGWTDGWSVWLPVWWDLFAMGMFLAVVSAWYGRQGRHPRWSRLPFSGTVCWLLAAACYWVAANKIGLPLLPLYTPSTRTDLGKHLFYGLFGFFLLLPAVFGPQRRGLVRRFLASRVMTFLGSVSYGVYLWHQTVIDVVMYRGQYKMGQVSFLPLFGSVALITILLATMTHYLVERPCQELARGWARQWRGRARNRQGSGGSRLGALVGRLRRDRYVEPLPETPWLPAPAAPRVVPQARPGAVLAGVADAVFDQTTIPVAPVADTPDTITRGDGAAGSLAGPVA